MKILDGKKINNAVANRLYKEIARKGISPTLVIIQIGDNKESNTYVHHKKMFAERIGARVIHNKYPVSFSESKIISDIKKFNTDPKVQGIIVQLPIPARFKLSNIVDSINPEKDVDGLASANTKRAFDGEKAHISAAAEATMMILNNYKISVKGKNVAVIGDSALVGKPVALALLNAGATITVCNSHTKDISMHTKKADIIVVAVGKPGLINKRHVSKDQVIIDIGTNVIGYDKRRNKNILVGDVDFNSVKDIVAAITPVPGGVGPVTIAALFSALLTAGDKKYIVSK